MLMNTGIYKRSKVRFAYFYTEDAKIPSREATFTFVQHTNARTP